MNNRTQDTHPSSDSFEQQEICRLLSAAVINARFRQALLSNPDQAIANGYRGEKFQLGSENRKRAAAIHANSLADFASQLTQGQSYARMSAAAD